MQKIKIVLTSLNRSKKSAHCLRCAGHAPVGLSKRGRDAILYLFIVYIHGFRFLLHHLCRMHGAVCHPQIRDTVIDQGIPINCSASFTMPNAFTMQSTPNTRLTAAMINMLHHFP